MQSPAEQILTLYEDLGQTDYFGEPVSQLVHGLQAARLAQAAGADSELILAALLHDIGHLCFADAEQMADVGVLQHEILGACYLYFLGGSTRLAELVAGHVDAKRYLIHKQPEYARHLSEASQITLGYQGGPMSAEEAKHFAAAPLFKDLLRLRAWDEAAKESGSEKAWPEDLRQLIASGLQCDEPQVQAFAEQGYLHLPGFIPDFLLPAVLAAVDQFAASADAPGRWMKYYENTAKSRQLCRLENFIPFSELLATLLTGPRLMHLLKPLFGEAAVLFKEKVNFKLPGGQGFAPHQDAPAFTSFDQDYHITAMISLDDTRVSNGCLEICPGRWDKSLLPMTDQLTLAEDCVNSLDWQPLPTQAGDLVLFDSYIPHRSGVNQTEGARRAIYATYNARSAGSYREAYFQEKRQAFPPDVERQPGVDYADPGVFNVGNPLD